MKWIALALLIEAGMTDVQMVDYSAGMRNLIHPQAVYLTVAPEVTILGHLAIGGGVKTAMFAVRDELVFFPSQSTYWVFAELRAVGFAAGARHMCTHPTLPYFERIRPTVNYEGGVTEIYIKAEF